MRINSYEIVLVFEIDTEAVLSCGPALKKLQKQYGGEILHINNTEGAPPPLPRIIHKMKDTSINLALDRIVINTVPPSHVSNNIDKSSKFALQKLELSTESLLEYLPKYQWLGIVVDIEFPTKDKDIISGIKAVSPVFERLIHLDIDVNKLASFQLQFGIKRENHFVNYSISGYEQRVFEFLSPNRQKFFKIDASDVPISECGIRLVLDVNNRPGGATADPVSDANKVILIQNKMFKGIPKDLNLEGILK